VTYKIPQRYQLAPEVCCKSVAARSQLYFSMAILVRSHRKKPGWLDETREFCKRSSIKIAAWGPDLLVVETESPDRAQEITSQLGNLGFQLVNDEDDPHAGLLSLSKDPAAIQAKLASFDITQRPWGERIKPLVWALGSLLLLPGFLNEARQPRLVALPLGLFSLALFFWDGAHIWGWRLQLLPEGLRIRRHYSWAAIPWEQISAVELSPESWDRNREKTVVVKRAGHPPEKLGTFGCAFARNLRDRLRSELAQRRRELPDINRKF
jgi:hypothetical protein